MERKRETENEKKRGIEKIIERKKRVVFFGPQMTLGSMPFHRAQPPSSCPGNGFARIKSIT